MWGLPTILAMNEEKRGTVRVTAVHSAAKLMRFAHQADGPFCTVYSAERLEVHPESAADFVHVIGWPREDGWTPNWE